MGGAFAEFFDEVFGGAGFLFVSEFAECGFESGFEMVVVDGGVCGLRGAGGRGGFCFG
jgi:hypothetical protein